MSPPDAARVTCGAFKELLRSVRTVANALAISAFAAGCAGLPAATVRTPSLAFPPFTDSALATIASVSSPGPTLSGFRLLPSGAFALSTRIELAQRAERSLDLQYYLIGDDATGRSVLRALRDAAGRGVRVRLLLDDLNTAGQDVLLLGLAAHANVEVRLFNPFPAGRGRAFTRFAMSLFDLRRLNHRMHNKLFVADGVMAVIGGRNIADEYFARHPMANFIDLDVFATGFIVTELTRLFDQYWNSPSAYPVESIASPKDSRLELRTLFEKKTRPAEVAPLSDLPGTDALGHGPLADELNDGKIGLVWSEAEAFSDPPEVPFSDAAPSKDEVVNSVRVRFNVLEHLREARVEVVLISPYFIPGRQGMDRIRDARRRDVKIKVLTNSLASTDQPLVHGGYLRYRDELLEEGVDLYEFSPIRARRNARRVLFGVAASGLHTKAAVFDDDKFFIGSMNFDPRSERYNTETGLFIHSPKIAREALGLMNIAQQQAAHRLRLTSDGQIQRLMPGAATDELHVEEPEAGFWVRWLRKFVAPLVPESLL